MGLLDRVLAVLGGGEDARRGERSGPDSGERGRTAPGERPADPPTEPNAGGSLGAAATEMQSHGSHWDTLVPDDGREAAIESLLGETIEEGEVIEGHDRDGAEVRGYRYGEGPLGTVAVAVGGAVATAYPVLEGIDHTVELTELQEWAVDVEAWLGGSLGDAAITAFATNYFAHPPEYFGGDGTVSLALLAYDLGPAEYDTVVGEDGEEYDLSAFAGFRPWERGAPDDYVVRSSVEDVGRVSHAGYGGYVLRIPLFRTEGEADVDVACFVADHVAREWEPAAGDTVEGVCWLQCWFQ